MKILKLNIFFGLLLVFSFQASTVFACHEGGSMGFASEDPLASTIDYSSGSTFIFASTFGTLGCKNWDFVKNNRVQYLDIAWNKLSEEVAQGESATFYLLSLANAGIAKCVYQIYPLLYPQMIGLCGCLTVKS